MTRQPGTLRGTVAPVAPVAAGAGKRRSQRCRTAAMRSGNPAAIGLLRHEVAVDLEEVLAAATQVEHRMARRGERGRQVGGDVRLRDDHPLARVDRVTLDAPYAGNALEDPFDVRGRALGADFEGQLPAAGERGELVEATLRDELAGGEEPDPVADRLDLA